MESRAINDLSNKWIEENINAAYFKRIKEYLKNGGDVKVASDKTGAFLQYGCDLSEEERAEIGKYYEMSESEERTALITRLKAEIASAKEAITQNNSVVLKKLVSYVDDTYSEEALVQNPGLSAASCEHLIGKIRFAIKNIEKIENGEIKVDFFEEEVL